MNNAQLLFEAASPKYGTWANSPQVLLKSITKGADEDIFAYYTVANSISINPQGNDVYISNALFHMVKPFLPENTTSTRYKDSVITGEMMREAIFDYGIIKPNSYIELVEIIFDRDTVKCVTKPMTSVDVDKSNEQLILQSIVNTRN